jgi:hypothetical protein
LGSHPSGPTLVVLAAGVGSRYGGDKQLDPIGPNGEILSDYAVADAARCGVGRAVFVIRSALEADFRAHHRQYVDQIGLDYAIQRLDDLPSPHQPPAGRTRPWGTTHALLAARHLVTGPCLVLNADDYYGPEAITAAGHFLAGAAPTDAVNVAYPLVETLSPHGPVSRALLEINPDGWLTRITERQDLTAAACRLLPPATAVSMNCWALGAGVLPLLATEFEAFLAAHGASLTAEATLPEALGRLASIGVIRIRVIPEGRAWLGVTYPADRDSVARTLAMSRRRVDPPRSP